MKTLYEYILTSALNYKNNTALVQNSKRLTYTTLLQKIVTLSDQLILEGLQKGDRVIVDLINPVNQFVASIAVIRAGGVTVPIMQNTLIQNREYIVNNIKPFTIITDQRYLKQNQIEQINFPHSIFDWNDEFFNNINESVSPESILFYENENSQKIIRLIQPDPSDLVFIHYENKTKKFLAFNHINIIYPAILLNQILDANPSHRELISFPICNIHGFSRVVQNLIAGITSFLLQDIEDKLDIPAKILKYKCNSLYSNLELFNFLINNLKSLTQDVLRNFILIQLNTDEISLIDDLSKLDLSGLSNTKIFLSYSPIEAPSTTLINLEDTDLKNLCVGFPLPGIKLKVIQSEDYTKNGKLCISGNNTMEGYYQEGKIDRSKFTDDNWLITDQYAFLDEKGKLYLKGTIDEVVFINHDIVSIQQINQILSDLLKELNCEYYLVLKQDPIEKNKKIPILFYVSPIDKTIEPKEISHEITKLNIDILKDILIFKVNYIPKSGNKVLKEELMKLIDTDLNEI